MPYQLRPYQQEAVEFALNSIKTNSKPELMCLSVGAGKTWIIAEIAKQSGLKTLILTVSKELCEQDFEKLKIVAGEKNIGMYSASWKKKEVENITVATIQSAARHPELWNEHKLLIVDEADNTVVDGQLGKLIEGKKVIGLTATPYAAQGSRKGKWFTTKIYPMHKIKTNLGWFWQPVKFNISEKDLLEQGYLCPIKIFATPIDCWKLKLQSNGGEYTKESVDNWAMSIIGRILEVMAGAQNNNMCHSGIVFMPSVESCDLLEEYCERLNISAKAVSYKTDKKVREKIIEDHKNGKLVWLINQGVCVRGFDNPEVDCLMLARPTKSLRLHRQQIGRAARLSPHKTISYVFDLTENCKTWGNLEDVEMGKDGWQDTILLRGKDISGMEISRIELPQKGYIWKNKKTI